MEPRAFCFTLLMMVMILLCKQDQRVDAASLRIDPNRLQFFEYETVTFYCEGFYGEVRRTTRGKIPSCTNSETQTASSCTIKNVYPEDSGEYWCKTGAGERSNNVTITVTNGSVILESPALPVMEGESVTLSCRNKTTSNLTATFYKDGVVMGNSSTGIMTIHSVSRSDEGLYKCNISGSGESAESWLTVRDATKDDKETRTSSSEATPWIVVTVLLVVLLFLVGLHHFGKNYWDRVLPCLSTLISTTGSAEDRTGAGAADADRETNAAVTENRRRTDENELSSTPIYYTLGDDDTQLGASAADADKGTYAAVTKKRKKKDGNEMSSKAIYYSLGHDDNQQLASAADADKAYAAVTKKRKQKEPKVSNTTASSVSSAGINPSSTEDAFYSTIS
ncbi:low affinity immunoglobulin gamma Fc region receptor III-like isoform X2 [Lates calcarifer]|uniref:low affinity immunoglobulin gamma Fc region receptor III-like isoform X2 n=1 Tax=Lates calcarifer TaxID=8187 RepID=UPI0021D7AB09|nr:low affinity immunoglobulin gamma Fc region receptor III-like isoform X2 [Lates calcarifer]